MKITDLDFFLIELPARPAAVQALVVRVTTESGKEGWGEAELDWKSGSLEPRRDILLPVLSGHSIFETEELLRLDVLSNRQLACALEMACWDLIGQVAGLPICYLLGGGYRQRIPVSCCLPADTCDRNVQVANELVDQGFHSLVLSATGDMETDMKTIRAVAEAAGQRVELRLDCQCRYSPETAEHLLREVEPAVVACIEDPVLGADWDKLASLRRQASTSLAVSRAIHRGADVLALARSGGADAIVIDPRNVGGLSATRQCAAVAEAAGLGISLCGSTSVGILRAAILQLAAATPSFQAANACARSGLEEDILTDSLEVIDGMTTVPESPGLGITVDLSKLEKYSRV